MVPVVSTYDSASTRDIVGASRVRQTRETATQGQAEPTAGQTSPQQSTPPENDKQLGIQPSGQQQEEFQPYGPDGRQAGDRSREITTSDADKAAPVSPPAPETPQQDPQVQQIVARMKATEEKVKAHEAAHKSAGGTATGPVSYTYTRGPDGRNYITGGEVPITISTGKTPQETISRMQQVIQAALAPADPSPQDRAVAAQAATIQQNARMELATAGSDTSTHSALPPTDNTALARTGDPDTISSERASIVSQQSRRAYNDPVVNGSTQTAPDDSARRSSAHSNNTTLRPDSDSPYPDAINLNPPRRISQYS